MRSYSISGSLTIRRFEYSGASPSVFLCNGSTESILFYKIHNCEVSHICAVLKTFPSRNHPDESQRVDETSVLHLKMRFFVLLAKSSLIFRASFVIRTVSFAICSGFVLFFPKLPLILKCINNDLKKYKGEKIFFKCISGRWHTLPLQACHDTPRSVCPFSSLILQRRFEPAHMKTRNGNAGKAKKTFLQLYFDEKSGTKSLRNLTLWPILVAIPSTWKIHIASTMHFHSQYTVPPKFKSAETFEELISIRISITT